MIRFWFGISLIIAIYLTILLTSETLAQIIGVTAIPVSILCLIFGIIIGNLFNLPSSWVRGTNYVKKNILQIAIVFLGLKMSLSQVLEVGFSSLTLIVIIFILVFVFSAVLKRIFFKEKDLITLISIGTVICGITAIIASNSVLRSKEQDVVIAVLIVVLWGSVGVFTYPFFVEWFFSSEISKGLFLGISIHDTSQVLAASLIHFDINGNSVVLETATITKLIRNLFLALLIPYLAIKVRSKTVDQKTIFKQVTNNIPLFVYGFLFFILLRTVCDQIFVSSLIWEQLLHWNDQLVLTLFGLALIALGLSIKIKELKGLSFSPIVIGLIFSLGVFFVGIVLIPMVDYL
tara:strand:+ start:393 stop:1433 length:1041 start_codon:yes stop_codon:yes gene_type:complete